MAKWITDIVINVIRLLLWDICSFLLWIVDLSFELVRGLLSLDFFSAYPDALKIYYSLIFTTLGFFIFFKIIKIIFRYYADEQYQAKISMSGATIIRKIFVITIIAMILPILLRFYSSLISNLILNMEKIFNYPKNFGISNILCSVSSTTAKNAKIITKCPDVLGGINKVVNHEYVYFPNTVSLLIIILVSGFVLKLMTTIFIAITNRIVGIVFRLIISPKILSDYIEEGDSNFYTWSKLMVSDISMNFIQMMMIIISFQFPFAINLDKISPILTPVAQFGLFIGALFAIIQAPGNLAQFLGSDASAMTTQANITQILSTINSSSRTIGSIAGGAALTLGAGIAAGTLKKVSNNYDQKKQAASLVGETLPKTFSNSFGKHANRLYNASTNHLKNKKAQAINRMPFMNGQSPNNRNKR